MARRNFCVWDQKINLKGERGGIIEMHNIYPCIFGPEISEEQLKEMRANLDNIDFGLAAQEEKKLR